MTIEEIRKGAPLGATHYAIDESGKTIYLKQYRKTINMMGYQDVKGKLGVVRNL